jgi:hypothetical protein
MFLPHGFCGFASHLMAGLHWVVVAASGTNKWHALLLTPLRVGQGGVDIEEGF